MTVHHGEGQRAVGAGPDRDVPVGALGRAVAQRIDRHHLGPPLLRLFDERPHVQVGGPHVARPQDDVARMDEALRVHSGRRPERHEVRRARARVAERPFAHGRTQRMEERVAHRQAVEDPLRSEIAVRQDRLTAVLVDDLPKPGGDLVERVFPADALEPALTLRADPPQREQDTLWAVGVVRVVVDLDAQAAAGERMLRISPHLRRPPVLDGDEHGAGIGAVVRTRAPHDPHIVGHAHGARSSRPHSSPQRAPPRRHCQRPPPGLPRADRAPRTCEQ
jgi:hypothetical protein